MSASFVSPDVIRRLFAQAMSRMYRTEVPLYGTLVELVERINAQVLAHDPALAAQLQRNDERARLDEERHGAIRVGTAQELATLRRLFAVMGMYPVGYYDLSVAGVPVHSTAFRPLTGAALAQNPFRVFTSLLRLELIEDEALRAESAKILSRRRIFTDGALALIEQAERDGGLSQADAERFVDEALETFRWHGDATVGLPTYRALHNAHRLVADVVSFRGPHINHLTPRTLDIDAAQAAMIEHGMAAKAVIEGPPRRACPILLRQTSFKALEEAVHFPDAEGGDAGGEGSTGGDYGQRLQAVFASFPDDHDTLRQEGLGYYRYQLTDAGRAAPERVADLPAEVLVATGLATADPIVYEDFLPVSAAGIFQSNLGGEEQRAYAAHANREAFEQALGVAVNDEFEIYERLQAESLAALRG